MQLDLDDHERALLREVLDEAFRDLRYEIADTDNSRYKASLRERESRLGALLDRLGGPFDPSRA